MAVRPCGASNAGERQAGRRAAVVYPGEEALFRATLTRDVPSKMTPEARSRVDARVFATLKQLPLVELRKARSLSQEQLAKELQTTQGEISKIEHRTDMYLSTLRNYVEAMGGRTRHHCAIQGTTRRADGTLATETFIIVLTPLSFKRSIVAFARVLDDIDGLFLGAPDARPSSPVNEDMWLNNADQVLTVAENEYARLEALISRYGGPDRIRSIG